MTKFADESWDEYARRYHLEFIYGEYSASVRKKLLGMNIPKPENLYDVLFTPIREAMLSKNEAAFNLDIDAQAKEIRNALLIKQIQTDIDIERDAATYRASQLAKNLLVESTLDKISKEVRDRAISSNKPSAVNIDMTSAAHREGQISRVSKNTPDIDLQSEIERTRQESKNKPAFHDLDADSASFRARQVSKNTESTKDIDAAAAHNRNGMLSANKPKDINLDGSSTVYREGQTSKNTPNDPNLDAKSEAARSGMVSANKEKPSQLDSIADAARKTNKDTKPGPDVDATAAIARENMQSKNKPSTTDLDRNAEENRKDMLSANKPSTTDLDKLAGTFREDMVAANKEKNINLDGKSEDIRDGLLSQNKAKSIDLDKSSDSFRGDLLSANKPKNTDLDAISQPVRDGLVSGNAPASIDLDINGLPIRNSLLSQNVNNPNGPDTTAAALRANLLSQNVGANIDLDANGQPIRTQLLSTNVSNPNATPEAGAQQIRNGLLSTNVPSQVNPETGALGIRNQLLNMNVESGASPENGATEIRNSLLASNVPDDTSVDMLNNSFRDNNLSRNVENPNDAETKSAIFRNTMLTKNVISDVNVDSLAAQYRENQTAKNKRFELGTNIVLGNGTSVFVGISNLDIVSKAVRLANELKEKIFQQENKLQSLYGLEVDGNKPKALITNAAQLYNIQNNTYALSRFQQGATTGIDTLTDNMPQGFLGLMTVNGLKKLAQIGTNTTPASVIAANQGTYLRGAPEKILKPIDGAIGTAESMMTQLNPSDDIAVNFGNKRGIKYVMDTIKKDPSIALAKNYDVQNTRAFIVGNTPDGSYKKAYQRFTISNPYAPSDAVGTLEFSITNYAIKNSTQYSVPHTMAFPPYIKSFTNSSSAKYNEIQFLGRPEPIYTYSNSTREGTIEFMVLTDFTQKVDIGYDYENDKVLTQEFPKHFTESVENNAKLRAHLDGIIQKQKLAIEKLIKDKSLNIGVESSIIEKQLKEAQDQLSRSQKRKEELANDKTVGTSLFKEVSKLGLNVYKSTMAGKKETDSSNGDITYRAEDTMQKLNSMKNQLMFRPAFFSGDKVDFKNRMDFLVKCTRPARNKSNTGFSFTYPPVCHLRLGDWFNYDVIINSVSHNYEGAPWCLDEDGMTQPMFATVTMSFNIVGTWGGNSSDDIPLAGDIGGIFSPLSNGKLAGDIGGIFSPLSNGK